MPNHAYHKCKHVNMYIYTDKQSCVSGQERCKTHSVLFTRRVELPISDPSVFKTTYPIFKPGTCWPVVGMHLVS